MQFLTDAEYLNQLLTASERNEKISRHIQAARHYIVLMAAALVLMACTVLFEARSADYAAIAFGAFVLGYCTRAIVGHMRRMRRRR